MRSPFNPAKNTGKIFFAQNLPCTKCSGFAPFQDVKTGKA